MNNQIKYGLNFTLVHLLFIFLAVSPALSHVHEESKVGSLFGTIEDAITGERIGWTTLYLEEINR